MYRQFVSIEKHLPKGCKRLGGAFHGTVINRNINNTNELQKHKDWKDWKKGFNAVVPWGQYEGGELAFFNAGPEPGVGLKWELREGDGIFFMGSIISHGVENVVTGVRNSLDLMVHNSTMQWKKKVFKEKGISLAAKVAPLTREEENARKRGQKKERKASAIAKLKEKKRTEKEKKKKN